MIGRIRGTLIAKQPPHILIEAAGVGYDIEAPMSVFYKLPELGQEAIVYTHFVVRDDAQLLYGFCDVAERELFRTLIKVNGVGPKLGLAILSGIEAGELVHSVHAGDSSRLVKLPGVGKKTAERLIVELKDKLSAAHISAGSTDDFNSTPLGENITLQNHQVEQEAISALVALGYKPQDAGKMVSAIANDRLSSEALIRQALKSQLR